MSVFSPDRARIRRRALVAAGGLLCSAAALGLAAARADQPPTDPVGTIEGDAIAVEGPMTVEVVGGRVHTILRSGSDIRVKSGSARIDLVEGGQLVICGPAHLSVLKSGGALTVALDSGTLHAHIEREPALTIYTPQIQAKPVAIGDGAQDTLVGLDAAGAMCIRASSGAVRIEQQLTGQSVLVPQSGDVLLTNGQIESLRPSAGHCSCEFQETNLVPSEISMIASAAEVRAAKATLPNPAKPAPSVPTVREEPVYQVFMPPLAFDASTKVQPEPDPRLILLVRRVRVRPTLIFQGRVEGDAVATVASVALSPQPTGVTALAPPTRPKSAPAGDDSVVNRVRNFLRRLWTRGS